MTEQVLLEAVKQEIDGNDFEDFHGISKENINELLVEPSLVNFIDASNGSIRKYWIVLDEDSSNKINGYQIVFDPEENSFGLATKTGMEVKNMGIVIGLFGSFIETLNAM